MPMAPVEGDSGRAATLTADRHEEVRMAATAIARKALLERLFGLTARGTDLGTEVRAGLTTFMVMSYIIILNAVIITAGATIAGQDVSFPAGGTSTCPVAGLLSAARGLWANVPFALAPGLGLP